MKIMSTKVLELSINLIPNCIHSLGSSLVPLVMFLTGNTFFIFLDLTGKPGTLLKYRIQEEKTVPVSFKCW